MIIFNNTELLSSSHQFNYLSDSLGYSRTNSFTIRGKFISDKIGNGSSVTGAEYYGIAYVEDSNIWYPIGGSGVSGISGAFTGYTGHLFTGGPAATISLLDIEFTGALDNNSPLYDIWTEMDAIQDRLRQFQEIIVEGVSIGSGRVTSFEFPTSPDPRRTEFTVNVETYSSGDFSNFSQGVFQNATIDPSAWQNLLSISESINTSTDEEGITSYDRDVSISLINKELDKNSFIAIAQSILTGLISGDPAIINFHKAYPSFYANDGKRVFSETYDYINGDFSFSESFGSKDSSNFYLTNTISLDQSDGGAIRCSENGELVITRRPTNDFIYSSYSSIKPDILSRIQDMISGYASCATLYLESAQQTFDLAGGRVSYSHVYSNDPYSASGFYIDQTNSISYSPNDNLTIRQEGTVKTNNGVNNNERLASSVSYFTGNIAPNILSNVYSYYTGLPIDYMKCACDAVDTQPSSNLFINSSEDTYSEFDGLFSYSREYVLKCSSIASQNFIVTRSQNIKYEVPKVWIGLTVGGEIAQSQNTNSLRMTTESVIVKGLVTGLSLAQYLAAASSGTGSYTSGFVADGSYSFSPKRQELTLSITYGSEGLVSDNNYNV